MADTPVDEVYGDVQCVLHISCKAEVLLKHERKDSGPMHEVLALVGTCTWPASCNPVRLHDKEDCNVNDASVAELFPDRHRAGV